MASGVQESSSVQLLRQLAQPDNVTLAIISGRSLDDLRQGVGLPDLIYAGNHGLEISGPEHSFVESTALASREMLQELVSSMRQRLQGIAGVLVEDKGLTATVHYRLVPAEEWEEVRRQVHAVLAGASHPFMLTTGHMAYEIRPRVYWNKGAHCRALDRGKCGRGRRCDALYGR